MFFTPKTYKNNTGTNEVYLGRSNWGTIRVYKRAWICLFAILFQLLYPASAFALSGGPAQPEFASFTPVGTTKMVNEFTGDFNYNLPILNVPGANGGGYPLSLSYNNETSVEAEASWVGLGWTLNPGAIQRNKRGFPDDWKGENVEYWNKVPPNWTVGLGTGVGLEAFSSSNFVSASASVGLRYNNYQGFGYSYGLGMSFANGVASIGLHVDNGAGSFSVGISPVTALQGHTKNAKGHKARFKKEISKKFSGKGGSLELVSGSYGLFTHEMSQRGAPSVAYEGNSTRVDIAVLGAPTPLPIGPESPLTGTFSSQWSQDSSHRFVHGYMYSGKAGSNSIMDFFSEKEGSYNKLDKRISIPVGNSDGYLLTGEGLGGGFRVSIKQLGHFGPNKTISQTGIVNAGGEIILGSNVGGGSDVGVGYHHFKVGPWLEDNDFSDLEDNSTDESILFRFNNDPGGEVNFFDNDTPEHASISYTGGLPGFKNYEADLPSSLHTEIGVDSRVGRSSYIGYNLGSDFSVGSQATSYKTYNKQSEVEGLVERTSVPGQIGEFSVVNEEGSRYTYGLPVYSRNERNLQFGLEGLDASQIQDRYIAHDNVFPLEDQKVVVGEVRKAPYATQYLLTEITDADYIDRTNDGPTADDFGGWTKFSYERKVGTDDKTGSGGWYKWRMPFNGLLYSRNSLSDPEDDMGLLVDGEKEIYYLKKIETKTHVAIFHTLERRDGRSANANDTDAAAVDGISGDVALGRLDNIELKVKDANGTPGELIKRVRFAYDYSLCGTVPNNDGTSETVNNQQINGEKGKLTLKKVWFEYEDVVEARISPYVFGYNYPEVDYPGKYDALEDYGEGLTQNPDYDPTLIDAWGNYQSNGGERFNKLQSWVNQDPADDFDPAAWQLKRVTLPSGGEIHVQYEQDDYRFVQDKPAHIMIPLLEAGSADLLGRYVIDHEEVGFVEEELPELRDAIYNQYVKTGERLYFKFLYKLLGAGIEPEIEDCNAEYITGYVNVKEVSLINNDAQLQIRLGRPGFQLGNYELPRNVCANFVKTQRAGKLSEVGSICDPSIAGVDNTGDPVDVVMSFFAFAQTFAMPATVAFCNEVNMSLSYLRLPAVKAKKGGGVRVKRLLLYDKGLDGDPQLFGSEYVYEDLDHISGEFVSSGVATNEPQTIREENVLVGFLPRHKQSFASKVVAGKDREQSEGFIGESYLPGASVGYSRVVVKNIHTGKTNPGYTEKRYVTAKRQPFIADLTDLDNSKKDYLPLPLGFVNRFVNNQWLSQGFIFESNNMHGQLASESTYAGNYEDAGTSPQLSSSQEYSYLSPGAEVNYWHGFGKAPTQGIPGREEELIFSSRKTSDIGFDGSVETDVDVGLFGVVPIPFLSFFPSLTNTETQLYTHATVKVIRHPTIVTQVKTYQDGIYHITKNKYFDKATGRPIITETYDGYNELDLLAASDHDGRYVNYSTPAHYEYPETGPKAFNERKMVASEPNGASIGKVVLGTEAFLSFSGGTDVNLCDLMGNFTPGDLVQVQDQLFHTGDPVGNLIPLLPLEGAGSGGPIVPVEVEIVRSGRTNQLSAQVGSVTTYGDGIFSSEPIPESVMAPREAFATDLNDLLANGGSMAASQVNGLEFVNEEGECAPIPQDCRIAFNGNVLQIIGPAGPPAAVVSGTPSNPHPMVTALNNYFPTFYEYELDPGTVGEDSLCSFLYTRLATVPSSRSDVSFMHDAQSLILNESYNCVNNKAGRIADFYEDINLASQLQLTARSFGAAVAARKNVSVVLQRIGTNDRVGIYQSCLDTLSACIWPCLSSEADCTSVYEELLPGLSSIPTFGQDEDGYLTVTNSFDEEICETGIRFYCVQPQREVVKCSSPLDVSNGIGEFSIDPENGRLVYYPAGNDCYPMEISCLRFCEDAYPSRKMSQVVASSASVLADEWDYEEMEYFPYYNEVRNDFEAGRRGKWRLKSSYVFKEEITGIGAPYGLDAPYAATDEEKNYNAGTYPLELFNYQHLGANNPEKWLRMSTVTRYSPNGNALEEENILGIKSSAKFGYDKVLPYAIAQNSSYDNLLFESFENKYTALSIDYLEDGRRLMGGEGEITDAYAHSGQQSLLLKHSVDGLGLTTMPVTEQLLSKGLSAKVWVKSRGAAPGVVEANLSLKVLDPTGANVPAMVAAKQIAQTGEWTLYEAQVKDLAAAYTVGEEMELRLFFDYGNSGVPEVWVDDVRIQPLDAQATCYVYDVTSLRLLTSFDDQHFGLYYQYNAEGQLVRKLIETERGMKTVQETQYNTPKVDRE